MGCGEFGWLISTKALVVLIGVTTRIRSVNVNFFLQVLDVIDIGPNRDARRQDRDFVYVLPTRVTYDE